MRSIKSLLIGIMLLSVLPTTAQQAFKQLMRETSQEFFQSDEARRIGDQLLLYQRVTRGWPKNIDMDKPLSDKEREKIAAIWTFNNKWDPENRIRDLWNILAY